jgi:hypothetical protein
VFVEADHDAPEVLAVIAARPDLPPPSYVLHSSPNRVHIFWRVTDFTSDRVEALQKQLAHELDTDLAATPCSQTTRLPGFFNHKYTPPHLVTIEYRRADHVYSPADFPVPVPRVTPPGPCRPAHSAVTRLDPGARAQRYLAALPPAIAGQHGDLHTFRVCCRLVRGFALSDADALALLMDWNMRCEPPWPERELMDKLYRARRYGREPIGGLLEAQP